jgi:Arc/MetJ-type ribon-helix-helix transcriptional regulator
MAWVGAEQEVLRFPSARFLGKTIIMAKSIMVRPKKRGRPPAGGRDPLVNARMPSALIKSIDNWAAKNSDGSRSEAIRRLVELGLSGSDPAKQTSRKAAAKASYMAGRRIDKIGDPSATAEERQERKRRLIKGPPEFRDMRGDQPKRKG